MKGFIQKEFEEFNNDLRTRIISNTSKIYQRVNLSRRNNLAKIYQRVNLARRKFSNKI